MSSPVIAPYVKPKNTLDRNLQKSDIISKIIKRVQEFPDYRTYKEDLEFLLFVCILAEHLVFNKKGKEKLDKKEVVIEVYDKCFGTNQINKDLIGKNIQFLFDNKRIKKVSLGSYICESLKEWFFRKIA